MALRLVDCDCGRWRRDGRGRWFLATVGQQQKQRGPGPFSESEWLHFVISEHLLTCHWLILSSGILEQGDGLGIVIGADGFVGHTHAAQREPDGLIKKFFAGAFVIDDRLAG